MLNIIIGHRGTGKTEWLQIIKETYKQNKKNVLCFDLDQEIEKESRLSIKEIFQKGENHFRKMESQIFQKIVNKFEAHQEDVFISVGAGFQFKKEEKWNVIHLSRYTDSEGRVFLNRPALSDKNPFDEYHSLYQERENYYKSQSDESFYRREMFRSSQKEDALFLGFETIKDPVFSLTIDPKQTNLKSYLKKRLKWGIRFFELNDQNVTEEAMQITQEVIPQDQILFSSQSSRLFCDQKNKKQWSWDLSLGEPPEEVDIVSLHDREKDIQVTLDKLMKYKGRHLKLAVEILNWKELKQAYDWWNEDPLNRSFLPRSQDGRWKWFRNLFGSRMKLHFIKEKETPILDQPFLSEAIHYVGHLNKFAAVIGFPIEFSATPEEHSQFMKDQGVSIVPIPIQESDFQKEVLNIMRSLGFVFLAVTSPLKKRAFELSDEADDILQNLKSANTLILKGDQWKSFNTDMYSIEDLKKKLDGNSVAVWGGGGVRSSLQEILTQADFYSARTGSEVSNNETKNEYDTLVWAVGRKRMKDCLWPPKDWTLKRVVDLNYTEDSPGKEYALKMGLEYFSGETFFKKQAEKQKELFLKTYKL